MTRRPLPLAIREGHKWSDGEPFTTEDFRFYFEDILGNRGHYTESGWSLGLV